MQHDTRSPIHSDALVHIKNKYRTNDVSLIPGGTITTMFFHATYRLIVTTILTGTFVALGSNTQGSNTQASTIKALIIDGQNNHKNWPQTTQMMKHRLVESKLFNVIDNVTHAAQGEDSSFQPSFDNYDVVISNFGHRASPWNTQTKKSFESFVKEGGGLVVIHAADNSFPEWKAYNRMIGLGGWGGRSEKNGPYVYFNDSGELIRDTSAGPGGAHGPKTAFQITIRDSKHPITRGMPSMWLHVKDELYESLRGPAENMNVLATAYSTRTQHHEPMMLCIQYGKGRVFHTPMGHSNESQECVGFITTFLRGCEWAASGHVTEGTPKDFPTADTTSSRSFRPATP